MKDERLLREWIPYARHVAQIHARKDQRIDIDDLESAALMAVVEAIQRFDGRMTFDRYCKAKIYQRISDCVREVVGRNRRFRSRKSVSTMSLFMCDSEKNSDRIADFALRDPRAISHCELTASDWLDAAIAKASSVERVVLRMRLEGYSMHEIAATIGFGESSAWKAWGEIARIIATECGRPERANDVINCFRGLRKPTKNDNRE